MKNQLESLLLVTCVVACSGADYDVSDEPPVGKGGSGTTGSYVPTSGGAPATWTTSRTSALMPRAGASGTMGFSGGTSSPLWSRGGASLTVAMGNTTFVTRPAATGGTTAAFASAIGAGLARGGATLIGPGSAATTPNWTTAAGGSFSLVTTVNGVGGAGGFQLASDATFTIGISPTTLRLAQGDMPCLLDSHCGTGQVCSMSGASAELAAMGIGHCVALATQANGTGDE